jgi:hypothetical protein
VSDDLWRDAMDSFTAEMPLREGKYAPIEKQAKEWAGGFGEGEQPWIPVRTAEKLFDANGTRYLVPPVKAQIIYPEGKNLPTGIPYMFDWSTWEPKRRPKLLDPEKSWAPSIPAPEGHRLPDGSVINKMTFDDKPWSDSAPIDVQAKSGYTNFSNDLIAEGELKPGEYWTGVDREHRNAKRQKAVDASQPPKRSLSDSLASLRGRQCRNCFRRIPDNAHGKVRYCPGERCRDRSEYARRSGQVGTLNPGIELSTFTVDGQQIGIDTDDRGFTRLLVAAS